MTLWHAIVLGLVQGFTEFLPISSSGHLVLTPYVLGWDVQDAAFDVMVHAGTFVAVVWVFWRDLAAMARACTRRIASAERRLGWMLAVSTIPVVVVGVLFGDAIEFWLRQPAAVAVSLIGWGIVLWAADVWHGRRTPVVDRVASMTWGRALLIGFAQVLSLIPGTSRSGITMTAALFGGLSREAAVRFSFLLSVPAVGGAAVYVAFSAMRDGVPLLNVPTIAGFVAAAIAGVLAIRVLLRIIGRWTFVPFAVYRIVLGAVILVMVF